jgi:hypothetical protein
MGERTLGRREVLMGAGVAAGGVALTGLGAAPAVANDQGGGDPSGSWLVTRQDDPPGDPTKVKLVLSFAGGNVFVSHDINPAGPPFTGTWAHRHGGRFKATFWTGVAGGPGGGPGPTIRVRLRGRRDHNTISGKYDFAVFDPVSDQQVDSGTGSLSGIRINA